MWNIFKKYHYLDGNLNKSCEQYIGVINNEIVCHTGVIHFPMRKGWKRVHRLVVLPDYQGIGIGTKFIKEIAKIYINKGYGFNLTTTTPSLVNDLRRNKNWLLVRYGRTKNTFTEFEKKYGLKKNIMNSKSDNRITYSFNYKK